MVIPITCKNEEDPFMKNEKSPDLDSLTVDFYLNSFRLILECLFKDLKSMAIVQVLYQ